MKLIRPLGGVASVAVLLLGCGGGGASSSTMTSDGTISIGSAKVKFEGNAKPFVSTSTYGVTVQGLVGAAFSYVDMYPQPSLLNTMLVYSRKDELYTYSFLTGQAQVITHGVSDFLSFNRANWGNGLILYPAPNGANLEQMYADGSHITALPAGGVVRGQQASWDGSRIAGLDTNGNLVVMYANGSNLRQLVPASALAGNFQCTWMGNLTIAFIDSGGLVKTISASGGTPSGNVSLQTPAYAISGFSDGPGGLIAEDNSSRLDEEAYDIASASATTAVFITPTGLNDSSPTVAPDNETVAFHRQKTGGANDGYSGIWTCTISGDNPKLLIPDSSSSDQNPATAANISWSPYPSYRRFIGTGGAVASASSGFLLSQVGAGLSGFFTFVAKTPSSATVTPAESAGTLAPLVYSIHADSITGMWWKNGYYLPSTSVASSSTTDVVVSFDGIDGQITFVAPALSSRGVTEKPRFSKLGLNSECSGHFAAIYDLNGKNLAPSGASTIEIDGKGKLVSFK